MSNEKVKEAIEKIITLFESDNLPQAIAYSLYPCQDVPCSAWSVRNRILCWIAGTGDARGFKTWQNAGRKVKPGSKAFYILKPRILKKEVEKLNADGEKEKAEENFCAGFLSVPVFRAEDTEGKEIEYKDLKLPENLPFLEKAKEWGLKIIPIGQINPTKLGCFRPGKNEILLTSPDEDVFFHELAHASHWRLMEKKGKKIEDKNFEEICVELSAAVLCQLTGKCLDKLKLQKAYIEMYAKKANKSLKSACFAVLKEVSEIVKNIIGEEKETE